MRALYATKMGGDTPLANLEFGERPVPVPGPGEVRIRVKAASLNYHDYWTLRGVVGYPIELPRILGCDAAGVVDAYGPTPPAGAPPVGTEVTVYPVTFCGDCDGCRGDDPMLCRKFMMLSDGSVEGSFAQFVVVPACNAVPKPPSLSLEEATCLGTTYLTAYRMLFVKARITPGQLVLVHGAGGGLASAAIQLAAAAGCVVISASRSEQKRARAALIGAAHTIAAGKDAAKAVLSITDGAGVDVVIESVGEPTWATSLRAVKPGGAIVVAGATGGANPPADLTRVFWRQLKIIGSTEGSPREFVDLCRFVDGRGIKPIIDRVYPFDDALAAFERLVSGDHFGKLVLKFG